MVAALVGGLVLVNQTQDSRRGAAFANTSLILLPSEKIVKKVDEDLLVHLKFATEGGAKLYNIETSVCFGPQLDFRGMESTGNTELGYGSPMVVEDGMDGQNKCYKVIALKEATKTDLAATSGEAAVLKFKAVSAGTGTIYLNKDKSKATGENAASETDKWITVTSVANTSYEITGTAADTTGPEIKFKMTYAGVIEGTKCAVDWPVKVVVLAGAEKKEITNVITKRTDQKVDGLMVYEGSFRLGTFATQNLALFIKGPKHLQMKYAIDGQSGSYGKAGGEISGGKAYDFTKYPALVGDVNVDGWVNGQDFSIVKAKAGKYEQVADGSNHAQDLDGSCQVNQRDLTLLVNSLDKKQEELY